MKFSLTTLTALLALSGPALAQSPPASPEPAKRERPAKVERPAKIERPGKAESAPTEDEELALAALEGLMGQPTERALPIIKKVLAGSQTTLVKQRALFVLSQMDSPEAQAILAQASRSPNSALRGEAIRAIGIGGDPKSLDSLLEIYKAGDSDVKREVLQAWLIAGRKEAVYQAALNAKTEDEASEAIHILGAMGATDELRKLGDRPNAASGLLDAFAISGDLASLRKIAEGSGERSVRLEAIRRIGIVEGDASRAALREIYTRSTDQEIKDAALQGMLMADDQQGVLTLYRTAKSSDEKRALLRYLAMMDGDAALQAIDAALEEKK